MRYGVTQIIKIKKIMSGSIPCGACIRKIMRFKYVNKYALTVSFECEYQNSPATIDLVFNKNNAAGMKAMLLREAGIIYSGGCYASSFCFLFFLFVCLFTIENTCA